MNSLGERVVAEWFGEHEFDAGAGQHVAQPARPELSEAEMDIVRRYRNHLSAVAGIRYPSEREVLERIIRECGQELAIVEGELTVAETSSGVGRSARITHRKYLDCAADLADAEGLLVECWRAWGTTECAMAEKASLLRGLRRHLLDRGLLGPDGKPG